MTSFIDRKIGLALSGGGFRAAGFHLGVLKHLAYQGLLEQVTFISTVSGGSLITGLIFSVNNNKWPSSSEFLLNVYPKVKAKILDESLETEIWKKILCYPQSFFKHGVSGFLEKVLIHKWGIEGFLSDLEEQPRWIINSTTYETGKNFRFMRKRMGDYLTGYVANPNVRIASALAASAGFPGLIGPYVVHTKDFTWEKYKLGSATETEPYDSPFEKLRLWDGGVYDNLGVEALFKTNQLRLRDGLDFLIVCDGSAPLGFDHHTFALRRAKRLVDIATSQSRNLMTRTLFKFFEDRPFSGAYFNIGDSACKIVNAAKATSRFSKKSLDCYLDDKICMELSYLGTRLKAIDKEKFNRLLRHGSEVANISLRAYLPNFSFREEVE